MAASLLAIAACSIFVRTASAGGFLTLRNDLFSEIVGATGAEETRGRIAAMEEALWPMYSAVPKNRHGRIEDAAMRYILHRFFVQIHGCHVACPEPGNDTADAEPRGVNPLQGQVTPRVEQMFNELLGGAGLSLRERAAVAVAVERLIHNDASARLQEAFDRLSISMDAVLEPSSMDRVLDSYMVLYIIGNSLGDKEVPMKKLIPAMPNIYPGWHDTQACDEQLGIRSA